MKVNKHDLKFFNHLNNKWLKIQIKNGNWTPDVCLSSCAKEVEKYINDVQSIGIIVEYKDGDATWVSNGGLITILGDLELLKHELLKRMRSDK